MCRHCKGHWVTLARLTSQVAFNANGDVFIADGYCNRRVMQYNADGTFIRSYTMANVRIPTAYVLHLHLDESFDRKPTRTPSVHRAWPAHACLPQLQATTGCSPLHILMTLQ